MELEEAIEQRKSVRSYADREVSYEELDKIIAAAWKAPAACGKRPWYFVKVDKEGMRGPWKRKKYYWLMMRGTWLRL